MRYFTRAIKRRAMDKKVRDVCKQLGMSMREFKKNTAETRINGKILKPTLRNHFRCAKWLDKVSIRSSV